MFDDIGSRMKQKYETVMDYKLTQNIPVIARVDGKAFHTLTKNCNKPFDDHIINSMIYTAKDVMKAIPDIKIAYVQSDEISYLFTDYETLEHQALFNYRAQKLNSVLASMTSVNFTERFGERGFFDCRVFNVPIQEVENYFRWRAYDWERNSLIMYCRSVFSQKQMQNKNRVQLHEMLYKKGRNWNNLDPVYKNGTLLYKNGKEINIIHIFLPNINLKDFYDFTVFGPKGL